MTSLFGVPVDAAYHTVYALTIALTPVLGGLAAVGGIVLLTLGVRALVMPLSFRAMRGQAIQARLAPQLSKLRAKYGKQPERLQREIAALYEREGTSMFAGLAPMLLQWPVLSVMYLLFRSPQVGGQPNKLLSDSLLGVPLGTHWLGGAGVVSVQGFVFLGMFALLALVCWLAARLTRTAANGLLVRALPYLTVVIAAFAPLAAGVYLVTSAGWSVFERRLFQVRQAGPPAAPCQGTEVPPGRPG